MSMDAFDGRALWRLGDSARASSEAFVAAPEDGLAGGGPRRVGDCCWYKVDADARDIIRRVGW